MTAKSTRRRAKRKVAHYRMSARSRLRAIADIYSGTQRSLDTVQAAWVYLAEHRSDAAALGVVAAVLRDQTIELGYVATQAKHLAMVSGIEVQS